MMTTSTSKTYRPELPPVPSRMQKLPVDERQYPVPWFVAVVDGVPDHRVIGPGKRRAAKALRLCWLCGEPLGKFGAFVIGPMCSVNKTSSEPPSHLECADFAARSCPFMTRPKAKRREANLPEERHGPAGIMLARNPGVTLVWVSKKWSTYEVPEQFGGGELWDIGEPVECRWYAEGRPATRAECEASIASGCPALEKVAREHDGPEGVAELARRRKAAEAWLPLPAVPA